MLCSRCGKSVNTGKKKDLGYDTDHLPKPLALYELTEEVIWSKGILVSRRKIWRTDLCLKCDKEINDNNGDLKKRYPEGIWEEI
jgi:hypothetical protein